MVKAGLDKKDIQKYLEDVQDTYVEEWEPLLASNGLTFRTAYAPMTKKEAECLVEAYRGFEKLPESSKKGEKFDAFFTKISKDPVVKTMLSKLQNQIDRCLKSFGCKKVFVKGSSRSAKDAVIMLKNMTEDFEQRCIAAKKKEGKLSINDAVISLLGAGKDAMSGTSAEYFLKLFVRSERIYQDMTLALDMKEFKSGWAIREWVDIDIGMEFRGFIHERKFCALCQYDYLVKIEKLQDEKMRKKLVETMKEFYEQKVGPALHGKGSKFKSYVADFALDNDGKCWIIELNPFQESTDGAMFSWATEKKSLTSLPFDFRYQKNTQNALVALSKEWRGICQAAMLLHK